MHFEEVEDKSGKPTAFWFAFITTPEGATIVPSGKLAIGERKEELLCLQALSLIRLGLAESYFTAVADIDVVQFQAEFSFACSGLLDICHSERSILAEDESFARIIRYVNITVVDRLLRIVTKPDNKGLEFIQLTNEEQDDLADLVYMITDTRHYTELKRLLKGKERYAAIPDDTIHAGDERVVMRPTKR